MELVDILASLRLLLSGALTNAKLGRLLSRLDCSPTALAKLKPKQFQGFRFSKAQIEHLQRVAAGECSQRLADSAQQIAAESHDTHTHRHGRLRFF